MVSFSPIVSFSFKGWKMMEEGPSAQQSRRGEGISKFSSDLPLTIEGRILFLIPWSLLTDQTPTPTRFLKNCEEVGLFSELDCSLEHEFRKAQEEESSKRVGSPAQAPPLTPDGNVLSGRWHCHCADAARTWPLLSSSSSSFFFFFF